MIENSCLKWYIIENFPPCWDYHIYEHTSLFKLLSDNFRYKIAIRKNKSKHKNMLSDVQSNIVECNYKCYLADALTIDADAKTKIDKLVMGILRDEYNMSFPDNHRFYLKRVLRHHPEITEKSIRKIKDALTFELNQYIQRIEDSIYNPDRLYFTSTNDFSFGNNLGIVKSSDIDTFYEWYAVFDETELLRAFQYECCYDAVITDAEHDMHNYSYCISHMTYNFEHITAINGKCEDIKNCIRRPIKMYPS